MKSIIESIGWPTRSKVGEWASYRAWLIVQHSAHDQEFMAKCLAFMQNESSQEVDPQNIAYLSDRLKTFAGLPQTYRTQYKMENGKYIHFEIEDFDKVDERRLAIGLPSIQQELERMNQRFGEDGDN